MKRKLFIRADGNTDIGLGHLIRCSALAEMLLSDFEISFYCIHIPEQISNDFTSKGFKVKCIDNNDDFIKILTGDETVVLDHYGLNTEFQKRIKSQGNKLVCIDDVFDKEFYADLIINHAPNITKAMYQAQPYTKFALGLDYVLLRTPFIEAAKKAKLPKKENSVFICFGGSDVNNLTEKTVSIVLNDSRFNEINVVVGSSYSHKTSLELLSKAHRNVKIHEALDADEMISLMKMTQLAILPCSGILLEALALKLTVIAGTYVDNQSILYDGAKKADLIIDTKHFSENDLKKAINKFFQTKTQQKEVTIDGLSGKRFKAVFFKYSVSLRPANEKDMLLLFDWANDPDVRKNAFNSEKIELENHKKWYSNKIKDANTKILILEKDELPLGQIRFDKTDDNWTIDYSIDAKYRGLGLGGRIIELGIEHLKEDVKAIVKVDNIGSCKVFENLGFTNTNEGNINVYQKKWKRRS
ncbi:UDP-2,4-diacetamido-2,4,6-trideoxy-beta-L-altropyranose hydrolase [Ulvibacter antarcticus]|uniref:UDP-2,4-diacetamido-2,4, 6-trideoxy-beta-L-altropyranose hydrolase n=1 Tax=Ulvibacter antarcticus TaxID=442714 RepID=A0A3L9Z1U9_9FLAO|nr:UDP-2,4-diacetamido-2,4,6-trideoxy-beta-L-altropyranose hydrolase [Ulvibacter antarcticus]RMA65987.1 UDP-2,4-diacetamido-2,4,6-trideoxy-beta-L-altropyranose hydrolase [Ulvibacter antarcticus]